MSATDHPSDEDLIARIGRGDRGAFEALYRRRRADVYRFALFMSGSPAAADDATQDVFVELIHHAQRFRPGAAAAVPWLFGIARNHVRRQRQRHHRSVSIRDAQAGEARRFVVDDDPLAGLARREHIAALRHAVLDLPVNYREAIVLCDLHELSYADAAVALGCAIGTVRSRLHRGRALLASRLRADDEGLYPAPLKGTP